MNHILFMKILPILAKVIEKSHKLNNFQPKKILLDKIKMIKYRILLLEMYNRMHLMIQIIKNIIVIVKSI